MPNLVNYTSSSESNLSSSEEESKEEQPKLNEALKSNSESSFFEPILPSDGNQSIHASTEEPAQEAKPNVKRENEEDCVIIDPPKKPRMEESYPLELPSTTDLKAFCNKLNIKHGDEAYKLWASIDFRKILLKSTNIRLHKCKSANIFACFSYFFTGKADNCYRIQHAINAAFSQELKSTENATEEKVEEAFTTTTVTEELLKFMAEFLECRIGIYENGILKKYGKWNLTQYIFTMVLSFEDGKYSIVLDL